MKTIFKSLVLSFIMVLAFAGWNNDENKHGGPAGIGMENGHSYVDLGLSVKWAICNVGAEKPEDYGEYYAWGETAAKDNYDWNTYKWCNGSYNTLTKYCSLSDYGAVDNKTVLIPEDDVAHVKWGGQWRMPTKAELDELHAECSWYRAIQNGVRGYLVTSKKTGFTNRSIFLPAAGCRCGTSLDGADLYGYYWSSSRNEVYNMRTCYLVFGSRCILDYDDRFFGFSVRPVCE